MHVHGSHADQELTPPAPRARGGPCVAAAVAVALALGGCASLRWAEITSAAPAASTAPPRQAERRGRVVIHSATAGGVEEFSLVEAALGMAGAAGRPRPAAAGVAHFGNGRTWVAPGRDGLRPPVVVRLQRDAPLGRERWFVDATWVVRQLDGGALLAWEGEFDGVLAVLGTLVPVAEGRPGR